MDGTAAATKRVARGGNIRTGISGWRYGPWRDRFYPKGLRQKDELAFAASQFGAIEINGTFYSLQRPQSFQAWAAATPDDFIFSVKGPRFITHMLKLRNGETPLANFFANGLLALGPKLGPILWQLPPTFRFDPAKLEAFFNLLPRDTEAAADLARRHDHRVAGRTYLTTDRNRPLRHALEIRHDSFRTPEFIDLLRRHNLALVCADTVEWPLLMDVTRTSFTAGCTARSSSIPAAMTTRPCAVGLRWSSAGQGERTVRGPIPGAVSKSAPKHRRVGPGAMCSSFLTTTSRCVRPSMLGA